MRALFICLFLIQSTTSFAGGFADRLFWHNFNKKLALAQKQDVRLINLFLSPFDTTPVVTPVDGTFDQRIDPFTASDTRTFKQQYFLFDSYATGPSSPVIYYICGESACSDEALLGAAMDYAEEFKAHLVTLEHRYYGKSQPFAQLDSASLKYLGTNYALADLANFEAYARTQWGWSGQWIVVGGSYAGSLSAFYREKYPQNVVAALASSAPVQPRINFEQYDYTVHQGAGPECAAAIQSVVAYIEASLDNADALASIKKSFQADEITDPIDFLYVVADMAAAAVQYGFKDQFCQTLLKTKDPVTGYLNGYAEAGVAAFSSMQITPLQDSFQSIKSTDPFKYEDGVGERQWFYQSCTEFGYFQTAYHDPQFSARSARINAAYHQGLCHQLFAIGDLDVNPVAVDLYQPLLNSTTTGILFTNGSTDPWANLSITAAIGNNTNPNTPSLTIEGAAHCSDLGSIDPSNPPAVLDAQNQTSAFFKSHLL